MPVPAVSDSLILLHGHRGRPKADKKQKVREIFDFTNFLARREGFEPPAFWSVGYLGAKMASFRLRFAVLASVHSENIPMFPSGTACSIRILGQKWVRSKCVALQTGSYLSQFVKADGGQAAYLADIDRQAQERFERLIEDMKLAQVITERLKAENAMEWTRRMNTILACAMEIFALLS